MPSPDRETTRQARVLLEIALRPSEASFADHELLCRIGRGASSDVYRARRLRDDRVVALKIMRQADAATDVELDRFLEGAALGAALDHPNIVPVLECGEREGVPFVAMALVEGSSLRQVMRDARPSADQAARMLAVIARAVHHAHERGVVHRDLKPANILIDEVGEPHVADFGLARRLDQQSIEDPGVVAGTLCYMAPEQVCADGGPPTCAADIYSLGVIFYELLTGELPVTGTTVEQLLGRLEGHDPLPPRALDPSINAAWQNVCLKALERDPARRYRSAATLADDLDRATRGEPTEARPPTLARQVRGWARRHPRARVGLVAVAAATLLAVALVLAGWRARAVEEAHLLDTNAFIASSQAGAALFQLRAYADRVERAARHPLVISLLADGQVVDPAPREMAPLAAGFDSVFLVNNEGRVLADWPSTRPEVFQRNYAFRDYFRGARRLSEAGLAGAYVARAYRSESRGRLEFAISAPVTDSTGVQLGLIVAPFQAKAAFGGVRIQEHVAGSGRIITALLGPRGNERGDGPERVTPSDFTFLVHPGLDRGAEYALGAPDPARLRQAFGPAAPPGEQFVLQLVQPLQVPDFQDPIPGFGGSWLAAFAPVGQTGFVVMVATRRDGELPWFRLGRLFHPADKGK